MRGDQRRVEVSTAPAASVWPPRAPSASLGAPPRQITCIGTAIPSGLSRGGYDDDDTEPDVIEVDDDDLELLLFGE